MRSESVELLARVFRAYLSSHPQSVHEDVRHGLSDEDVDFLVQAVEVVASYNMPHDLDQESTQQRKKDILEDMEKRLRALDHDSD